LSDRFPVKNILKQGDALLPLLFNYSLEYVFRRVQANQKGVNLNGTHQLLICTDDVNILSRSTYSVKKNTDLLVASIEIGIVVNAEEIRYMVVF
jgi:hypothetical protein